MSELSFARHLVINFNSPELNHLATALARKGQLTGFVRPYVNQGRLWERVLAQLPLAGPVYASTFGRRRLPDLSLRGVTHEAGVAADMLAAAINRSPWLSSATRTRWANRLYKSVRLSVAAEACRRAAAADVVVGYEGFALPAFECVKANGKGRAVLNYPVAHHRHRRRYRLEELEREPMFASTWPDFDDWPAGHEQRLDEEIRLADVVLLGSSYAKSTFVAEGVDGDKIKVVPYGVDLAVFRPALSVPRRPGFHAIFAGQLTQRKGLSYLLRGYRAFRRHDTQLTLVGSVVGDATALAPLADIFEHVPHRTRVELAHMYRASDVFVFPTLVEGMPLVVLEAMACGLPVIVTANGPGDIVRDGVDGFVVPERDADAVRDRLERLYLDRERCAEMGRNAAQRALQFGWDAYADCALQAIRA